MFSGIDSLALIIMYHVFEYKCMYINVDNVYESVWKQILVSILISFCPFLLLVLIGALILRWDYILCFVSGSGD